MKENVSEDDRKTYSHKCPCCCIPRRQTLQDDLDSLKSTIKREARLNNRNIEDVLTELDKQRREIRELRETLNEFISCHASSSDKLLLKSCDNGDCKTKKPQDSHKKSDKDLRKKKSKSATEKSSSQLLNKQDLSKKKSTEKTKSANSISRSRESQKKLNQVNKPKKKKCCLCCC